MRIRTKGDGVKAAKAAIASYQEQRADLSAELQKVEAERLAVGRQLDQTLEDLATGLVTSAEPAAVVAAGEETGAMHLAAVLDKLRAELDQAQARIAEIAAMDDYQRREELTHPTTGEYSGKIEEFATLVSEVERTLAPFKMPEFQWLYKRGVHEPKEAGVFGKFWRVVTLADRRETAATEKVLKRLKYETFAQCADIYDGQRQVLSEARKNRAAWQARHDAVLALVQEHDDLVAWTGDFDRSALDALRQELAEHLSGCDFAEIHNHVRPAGKILAAKADALTKKVDYLRDMQKFLSKEIADREARIASIQAVQSKWRRKPYGLLQGDKSKWLVKVPEMKRASTAKRVRWCGTMRSNVAEYDHYDEYSGLLSAGVMFLAYDAFNMAADERPPYEGFSREVLPDLDEFRVEHDMERADYSELRGVEATEVVEDWDQSATEAAEMAEAEAAAALAESEAEESFADDS